MKALILGGLLCLALNAPALTTINFSGEIAGASGGPFHYEVGDTFTGWVWLDETQDVARLKWFGCSITVAGKGAISWTGEFWGGQITPTEINVWGNPVSYFGSIYLTLSDGIVTGGQVGFGSEPLKNMGSWNGFIYPENAVAASVASVPDASSALGLLALGFAVVVLLRFHQVNASARFVSAASVCGSRLRRTSRE